MTVTETEETVGLGVTDALAHDEMATPTVRAFVNAAVRGVDAGLSDRVPEATAEFIERTAVTSLTCDLQAMRDVRLSILVCCGCRFGRIAALSDSFRSLLEPCWCPFLLFHAPHWSSLLCFCRCCGELRWPADRACLVVAVVVRVVC